MQLLIAIASHSLGILFGWLLRGVMKNNENTKKRGPNFYIGVAVTVLALVSLFILVTSISEYRTATNCQAQYNKNFAAALVERQEASKSDRESTRALAKGTVAMWDVFLNPTASVEDKRKAAGDYRAVYKNYLIAAEESEKKLTANPIPLVPECALK